MNNRRMQEIQVKADEFTDNCKVIRYCIADIFSECERMGVRLIRYPIGFDGVLGFAQIREDDKIIFTNSSVRLAREIFSAAHEIGHLCLHMHGNKTSYVDDARTFGDYSSGSEETEANYFAACLLMPEDKVSKYIKLEMNHKQLVQWTALDIAKMMTAFNVSFDMVLNRLQNLSRIDSIERSRLDNEKNQMKVSNLLKMTGGNSRLNVVTNEKKIPGSYMEWMIDNYNHGVIPRETLSKALGYMDVSMDDISEELHPPITDESDDLDELIGGMDE